MPELRDFLENELLKLGITPDYIGYDYLASALVMTIDDDSLLKATTTRLYPTIAKEKQTTSANVERGIHTVIKAAWGYKDRDKLTSIMGRHYPEPVSNGKFIAIASRYYAIRFRRKYKADQ